MAIIRTILVALVTLAATGPVLQAQPFAVCSGGMADGFPCDQVDLSANLPASTFDASFANDIWGWTDPQDGSEYALLGLDNGVAFVNVTDPASLVYLGKLPTATTTSVWRDIKVYENYAFVVADFASDHGMQIFDLTRLRDVASPPETFTEDANYNGIVGNEPNSTHNIAINEDSGFAYLVGSDDCAGGLHMVNIQNPLSPTFAGCFSDDGVTHDVQCVTYAGPDTDYTGSEVCIASNEDTITIVDVTDKANPVLVSQGHYPNPGFAHQGWLTEDHRYFLLDDELDEIFGATSNTRTIIFDLADLDNPDFHAFYFATSGSTDHNLYIRGNHAFQSNYNSGLRILDLTDIESGILTEKAYFDTYPTNDDAGFSGQWSNYPFFESENIIVSDGTNGLFVLKPTFALDTAGQAPLESPGEDGYALSSAYPNPFSAGTRLTLSVASAQHVSAEVLDITGRRVATVYDGSVTPGASLTLTVDGAGLPSGLYLVRVTGEDFSTTRRISLVR
ncbi:MAG: choice-of-anchor B family protein [Bacteroidetes bacterium]|nr:choice-of-anchor B family protein [Bacteroidota bacterium]